MIIGYICVIPEDCTCINCEYCDGKDELGIFCLHPEIIDYIPDMPKVCSLKKLRKQNERREAV